MVPLDNSRTWVPYMSTRDCSQGFCSLYCPQWCYIIFPPPPPFDDFPADDDSGPNFSPLVIGIIGILASALLLVSYYVIMSKCCGNRNALRRRENHLNDSELEENQDPSNHDAWHVNTTGLEESLIKSITMFKYNKGGGLAEGTDCSVCLSEFQEDESLRLLPKCSHAFHVTCIDTWLKSHSNCPLCRANIVFINAAPPPLYPPVEEVLVMNQPTSENQPDQNDIETGVRGENEEVAESSRAPRSPVTEHINQETRRSVSMDNVSRGVLSIADILKIDQDEECETSKQQVGEEVSTLPHCVSSPMGMKRSFSSGRFMFPKRGRGQNMIIPL